MITFICGKTRDNCLLKAEHLFVQIWFDQTFLEAIFKKGFPHRKLQGHDLARTHDEEMLATFILFLVNQNFPWRSLKFSVYSIHPYLCSYKMLDVHDRHGTKCHAMYRSLKFLYLACIHPIFFRWMPIFLIISKFLWLSKTEPIQWLKPKTKK